ncbi:ribonuclease Z [Klebsiella pneumoniae]|uniref:Ribonuclease Z n=1 Tax=Klebsiella pneumoniae TaxID=573 RepID=A0A378FXV3_KLEPN|nr:ribonuclease Z [Klebsiella pneumoniae]
MELTFLGTSAGVPTRTRNMTSIILNLQQPTRAEMWLFDCGEGTQHQFLHTPYHPGKLNKIFITHLHGDHLFGLPRPAVQPLDAGKLPAPSPSTGQKDSKSLLRPALRLSGSWTDYPLTIIEVGPGLVFRRRGLSGHRVSAQPSGGVLWVSHCAA